MTTRYDLIAVEQPGTNVKALHLAYYQFVERMNAIARATEKNNNTKGNPWWWTEISDPQVHIIDNSIVVFAIQRTDEMNEHDEEQDPLFTIQAQEDDGNTHERVVIRGIFPERTLEVEHLPLDEPPVLEPFAALKPFDMSSMPTKEHPFTAVENGIEYTMYWKDAVEPLPFDEPPVPEPVVDSRSRRRRIAVQSEPIPEPVVEPPKRKRGRPRKSE